MLNGAQRNAVEWSGVKHLTLVKRRFFASARPSLRSDPAPAQNDGVFASHPESWDAPGLASLVWLFGKARFLWYSGVVVPG